MVAQIPSLRRYARALTGDTWAADDLVQDTLERACSKLVAVALYLIAQILCLRAGRVHTYVMIEPALARALRRVGLHFIQIGEPIEFNGIRAPYYLDARTTNATLSPEYLQLRVLLEKQLFDKNNSNRPQMTLCYSAPEQPAAS